MAYLENFQCLKCEKHFGMQAKSSRGWCGICENEEIDMKRRQVLAGYRGLSVGERLFILEEKVYDLVESVKKIDAAVSIYTTRF